jgi:ABC-type spermidine/putrescine transport system permease subunit II
MNRPPAFADRSWDISAKRVLLYVFALTVLLFLIVPIFIIIPLSFSSTQYLAFPPQGFSIRVDEFGNLIGEAR